MTHHNVILFLQYNIALYRSYLKGINRAIPATADINYRTHRP